MPPLKLILHTPPGRGSSVASVPIHWTIRAGSVKWAKTTSGLAAIRVSYSARCSVSSCGTVRPALGLFSLGDLLQALQPARQDLAEEVAQLGESLGPD